MSQPTPDQRPPLDRTDKQTLRLAERPFPPTLDNPPSPPVPPALVEAETHVTSDSVRSATPQESADQTSVECYSRYRALRPLGKGALGEVFVARDEELNREVALKEVQQQHVGNSDSLVRFLLEAEVTGRLEHPGVVPVYGLGRYADGRPYYAMRLIKGETIKDAIQRFHECDRTGREPGERSLAFRELLRRFIDVCNAVAYAHSKGVLHRDLKPAYVMLGPFGETLVIDWGLAKVLGRPTGDSTEGVSLLRGTQAELPGGTGLAGTPGYLSPEQAEGLTNELTPASDVYGLGAILYVLLTGKAAFKGGSLEQILGRQLRGQFAPPRQVKASAPAALEAVCLKAMALKPEERYASAKELAADVDHWLADEPVMAFREPLPARVRRWGRRHRALVSSLAALVLTLTAALAVGLWLVNAEKNRTAAEQEKTQKALKAESAALTRVTAEQAKTNKALEQVKDLENLVAARLEQVKVLERLVAARVAMKESTEKALEQVKDDKREANAALVLVQDEQAKTQKALEQVKLAKREADEAIVQVKAALERETQLKRDLDAALYREGSALKQLAEEQRRTNSLLSKLAEEPQKRLQMLRIIEQDQQRALMVVQRAEEQRGQELGLLMDMIMMFDARLKDRSDRQDLYNAARFCARCVPSPTRTN